ncbi:hypothetical protein [Francisella frigiditurris]|uniref:Uncharacterized protein n=1 Tax=Francisella frigiditurris TaxID=1542390 RepID=A0A1J0KUA3_9GAMM|nr:hypothetical protein [Francisella frigiditurris]APC97368.1 hypothetical protein KX01_468 [Francisella frigiditurris]
MTQLSKILAKRPSLSKSFSKKVSLNSFVKTPDSTNPDPKNNQKK